MYTHIEASLVATGLTSIYMDKFIHLRITDSVVKTFIKYPSLRQNLMKIISVEEHMTQFLEAFRLVESSDKPVITEIGNYKDHGSRSTQEKETEPKSEPKLRQAGAIIRNLEAKAKTDVGFKSGNSFLTSISASNSNLDVETLINDLNPSTINIASRSTISNAPIPTKKLESEADSGSSLPKIQRQSSIFGSTGVKHVATYQESNEPKEFNDFNEVIKWTGAPEGDHHHQQRRLHQSTPDLQSLQSSQRRQKTICDDKTFNSSTLNLVKPYGDQHRQGIKALSQNYEIQNKTNTNLANNSQAILTKSLVIYETDLQSLLTKIKKRRPFALDSELVYCNEMAKQSALDFYLKEAKTNGHYTSDNRNEELIQSMTQSFRLSLLENSKIQTETILDAIVKLEIFVTSLMEEKINRLCSTGTGSSSGSVPSPYSYLKDDVFENAYMECVSSSQDFFKQLLNLDVGTSLDLNSNVDANADLKWLESLPLAKKNFQKILQTLKEPLQLQNNVRKLQAEIKLKEDVLKLTSGYKNEMELKIGEFKYWTPQQFEKIEGSARTTVINNFNLIYSNSKSPQNDQNNDQVEGKQFLLQNIQTAMNEIKKLMEIQNDRYLISFSRVIEQLVNDYAKKMLLKMKDPKQTQRLMLVTHKEEKRECLIILKTIDGFDRLQQNEADKFITQLKDSIDSMFELLVPAIIH